MEFCRNCQSRLRPVAGENEAIQPGEVPTKKVTAELEPLLPQWLRDARQKARDTQAEEPGISEEQPAAEPEPPASDLLAGLASQGSDEEEEIPDWLAQITGAQTKKKKPAPEENQVKWVELGRAEEAAAPPLDLSGEKPKAEPAKDDLSDWFAQAAASSETVDFGMPAPQAEQPQPPAESLKPSDHEDLSWLRSLDAAVAPSAEEAAPPQAIPAASPPSSEETPDWLKQLQADQPQTPAPQIPAAETPSQAAVPDWLKSFGEEIPAAEPSQAIAPESSPHEETIFEAELPDWLKSAEPPAAKPAQTSSATTEAAQQEAAAPVELPDWISALGASLPQPPVEEERKPTPPAPVAEQPPAPSPETPAILPDWLSSLRTDQAATPPETTAQPELPVATSEPAAELPDWLSSLQPPQEATPPAISPEPEAPPAPEAEPAAAFPDWLSSLRAEQEATPPTPAAEPEKPVEELVEPSAALTGEDADAIFSSMQTPDWLSAVLPPSKPPEASVPAAAAEEEPIGPAELPSWVQAMRPVESAMVTTPSAAEDVATEAQGPLAGLHGVLPAIPGAAVPSSKPKAHSIKLIATEQQQAHAALLEQILAAETSPIPIKSTAQLLRSQKVLRWALSVLLIVVLGGIVFARTEMFPLPSNVPNETVGAFQSVESIPEGAPVLLVFDYQPATVGEMEASGASLIDHLLLLKHPKLALLSTSPTGPALAERFMTVALADRAYVRGQQYVDLGFLPGGLAGVYNFAQNPSAAIPFDVGSRSNQPVWGTGILTHVERYSDFAAVIVLTDSVESGRTWVEQTQATRGNSLLVMVTSAQAGPMLMPYVDSKQVNGMVSGIYGAAGAEQRNAGSPAIYGLPGANQPNPQPTGYVRRFWDAYSAGLYLAVIAIVLGALVNGWLGLRDRRANAVG